MKQAPSWWTKSRAGMIGFVPDWLDDSQAGIIGQDRMIGRKTGRHAPRGFAALAGRLQRLESWNRTLSDNPRLTFHPIIPVRLLSIHPSRPNPAILAEAAAVIRAGGVVAYPTETFYGLGADPRSAKGVAAVFAAKGRAAGEALPLIAADVAAVERLLGKLSPLAARLVSRFWPGPLTLVVPLRPGILAEGVSAGRDTIAVRVSDHPVARALADAAGGLITSTSANRSGEPPAVDAASVASTLGERIDLIIDAGAAEGLAPSTLVDVTADVPRLVRPGRVPFDRVLESLQ